MHVVAESMNNGANRVEGFEYLGDKLIAASGCLKCADIEDACGLQEVLGVGWSIVWKEVVSEVEGEGV